MAPIDFEKRIKVQFDARNIQPSENAWHRVSKRLGIVQRKEGIAYRRYAVAAVISGILLAGIWLLTNYRTQDVNDLPVVNTAPNQGEYPKNTETDKDKLPSTLVVEENSEKGFENAEEPLLDTYSSNSTEVVVQEGISAEDSELISDPVDNMIDVKINELVAQLEAMESGKEAATDAEVDSLLRKAQQELLADKEFRSEAVVNPSDLLAGVEEELDESFRDRVFEKLKQGFIKVRTAVADRNN